MRVQYKTIYNQNKVHVRHFWPPNAISSRKKTFPALRVAWCIERLWHVSSVKRRAIEKQLLSVEHFLIQVHLQLRITLKVYTIMTGNGSIYFRQIGALWIFKLSNWSLSLYLSMWNVHFIEGVRFHSTSLFKNPVRWTSTLFTTF